MILLIQSFHNQLVVTATHKLILRQMTHGGKLNKMCSMPVLFISLMATATDCLWQYPETFMHTGH